jgi:hypothetical protein
MVHILHSMHFLTASLVLYLQLFFQSTYQEVALAGITSKSKRYTQKYEKHSFLHDSNGNKENIVNCDDGLEDSIMLKVFSKGIMKTATSARKFQRT